MLRYLFIVSALLVCSSDLLAQGCSDAGFCTMGAMKPDQPYNKKVPIRLMSVEFSLYRGTTTLSPVIYSATIDANFRILKKTSLQIKVPYLAARGNFGNTAGLSDISLCLTRSIYSTENFDINVSIGGKIPTNNSDLTSNKFKDANGDELPLPMYYQTSLGTWDAIAGVSFITRQWLFATGVQYAFNENGNQFAWQEWSGIYPSDSYLQKNTNAIDLKRGTDIMLRVERNFRFSQVNFSVGLLPIFRVTNDETTDYSTGERVKPDGAKGMALSAIGTAGYNFNVRMGVKLLAGFKLVQREVNPDGLTRHMVTTMSYYYRF